MSLILPTLTSNWIKYESIATVYDIIMLSYVRIKKMSISTAKDYLDIFVMNKRSKQQSSVDTTELLNLLLPIFWY
jgi:hypothetical protein